MKTAFTLIEILIVVILLGVLAAIVVPQFAESADDAKLSACKSNIKALETASALYNLKEGAAPTTMTNLTTASGNNDNKAYMPSAPVCQLTNGAYSCTAGVWTCAHTAP